MGYIPGVKCTVKQNGSEITNVVGVSYSLKINDTGFSEASWQIDFKDPTEVASDDTWTIIRKVAGASQTLIDACYATSISQGHGVSGSGNVATLEVTRTVSGKASGSADADTLLRRAVPKTLVFCNPDWLDDECPGWTVVDGIVKTGIYYSGVDLTSRFYHHRLPPPSVADENIQMIVSCKSHHDCARWIAQQSGYSIHINVPDITLIDTYTVESGTEIMSAITANFAIWGAVTEVQGTDIYIMDVLTNSGQINPVQTITIDNPAITSFSDGTGSAASSSVVDHLIVTGRKSKNTQELHDEPDYTIIELPALPKPSLDLTLTMEMQGSNLTKHRTQTHYTGNFGVPDEDEFTPKLANATTTVMKFHEITDARGGRKYIPIETIITVTDASAQTMSRTNVEHTYTKGWKVIKTVEKLYINSVLPRTSTPAEVLCQVKTTCQQYVVKALNQTLTHELFEELLVYDETVKDEVTYYTNPQPLSKLLLLDPSRQVIDTAEDAKQYYLWMTTKMKTTEISRVHGDILIKRDIEHDVNSRVPRVNSQILDNPLRDKKTVSGDAEYRKEYFLSGAGISIGDLGTCYHPAKSIHHEDITSDTIADQIAERLMAFRGTDMQRNEVTLKTPVLILLQNVATMVHLNDYSIYKNGTPITIPAGDYDLLGEDWKFTVSGSGNALKLDSSQQFKLRERVS